MSSGIVYTETVIHSAPAWLASEAPYQIALVDMADGERRLVRLQGDRAKIGDTVGESAQAPGLFEVQA